MMITIEEIREIPEAKRIFRLFLIALVLWATLIAVILRVRSMGEEITAILESGDQVINVASAYRSYPDLRQSLPESPTGTDSLASVSEIVEALGLRSRMSQLQANASGVQLQLDRLYGSEMREFLNFLEEKELRVRTAEVKTLSSPGGLVLNASFLLE
jgi:type II secretory pathway component PulM